MFEINDVLYLKYGSIRSTGLGMVMQMAILGSDFEIWNQDIFNELPPVCRNFCRNAYRHVGRAILRMPVCIGTTKSAEIVINVDYDMIIFSIKKYFKEEWCRAPVWQWRHAISFNNMNCLFTIPVRLNIDYNKHQRFFLSRRVMSWPCMVVMSRKSLTHWGRDKMAAILQTIFSNAFSWMKMYPFWLRFH